MGFFFKGARNLQMGGPNTNTFLRSGSPKIERRRWFWPPKTYNSTALIVGSDRNEFLESVYFASATNNR